MGARLAHPALPRRDLARATARLPLRTQLRRLRRGSGRPRPAPSRALAHRAPGLQVPSLPSGGLRPGPLIGSRARMDRKVLLAMVMIMMVLLVDQAISPRFYRGKPKPAPTQGGPPGQGSAPTTGGTSPATGGSAPTGGGLSAGDSGTGATTGTGLSGSGPPGSGSGGGTLSSGAVLTKPRGAPAPPAA